MSAFAGIGRILYLGALCCSAAFLDVHSGRSASAPEANGSAALPQLLENKSSVLAMPQLGAYATTIAACRANQSACTEAARRFLSIVDIGRRHDGRARLGWLNRAVNMTVRATS